MYLFGKKFVSDVHLNLEKVFPTVFPFGLGGPSSPRENKVSYEECLRHYRDLCIPAMHKDDFILVCNHLLNRIVSYKYANIKCNKKISAERTLGEQFSNISMKDLENAFEKKQINDNNTAITTSDRFLNTVEACCRPIQHTAEAAKAARGKYFALFDRFGMGSIFVTISPTGNRNLHVKAFALAQHVSVPSPSTMTDNDCTLFLEEMIALNNIYPGAGELEFRSQLDIFIESILNWDRKNTYLKVLAYLAL